jgi:hypothetical protein
MGSKSPWTCRRCGVTLKQHHRHRHVGSKACANTVERRRLRASGMERVGHSWTILRAAGLYDSRSNKEKYGENPQLGHWAPGWAVRLCDWFRNKWAHKYRISGRQLLMLSLRVAKHDARLQAAIDAAHALGGDRALINLLEQELLDG